MVPGDDGKTHEGVQCHYCKRHGHYIGNCPKKAKQRAQQGTVLLNHGSDEIIANPTVYDPYDFCFAQVTTRSIPDTWILLDSQSTCSIFKNPSQFEYFLKAKELYDENEFRKKHWCII